MSPSYTVAVQTFNNTNFASSARRGTQLLIIGPGALVLFNGWLWPQNHDLLAQHYRDHPQAFTEYLEMMCRWIGEISIKKITPDEPDLALVFSAHSEADGMELARFINYRIENFVPPIEPVNYETGMPIEIPEDW